ACRNSPAAATCPLAAPVRGFSHPDFHWHNACSMPFRMLILLLTERPICLTLLLNLKKLFRRSARIAAWAAVFCWKPTARRSLKSPVIRNTPPITVVCAPKAPPVHRSYAIQDGWRTHFCATSAGVIRCRSPWARRLHPPPDV